MKLQVIEPLSGGHHTNYIADLVRPSMLLLQSGQLESVVITVTRAHKQQLIAQGLVPLDHPGLSLDDGLAPTPPNPSAKQRGQLYASSRAATQRVRPDFLLCTSADYDVIPNAMRHWSGLFDQRDPVQRAGVLHYGYLAGAYTTPKETAKRLIYETAWRAADWNHLLMVNPLVYEGLRDRGSSLARRAQLLPDPVPEPLDIGTEQARQRLGIPIEGRYVGFVGMMDRRKAIPELCAAFNASDTPADARLLLAGRIDRGYRSLIDSLYGPAISSGRLVLVDRMLSQEEVLWGYAAVDVHAVLQYRRVNLSANVLKAVSFGKLVVVDDHGHTGMVANRFSAGLTCNVADLPSIAAALQQALARCRGYTTNAAAKRLMAFHHPTNFARVALGAACGPRTFEVLGQPLTWEWVCEGLAPGTSPA